MITARILRFVLTSSFVKMFSSASNDIAVCKTVVKPLPDVSNIFYMSHNVVSAITSEIGSFITQTFAENDITELSIVGRYINM